jgi:hypothetical protein
MAVGSRVKWFRRRCSLATLCVPQVSGPSYSSLGGAIMFRVIQFSSRLVLLVLALAFIRTADAQKQSTRSPHGPLAIPCENCHTNTSWVPIRAVPEFSHDSTRYPLRGMHEKVSCTQCHIKPVFTDVGKNCADCHADIHRRQMGANCAQCHTVSGWNVSNQSIKEHFNRFPLLGAHAVVQCDECHKGAAVGNYLGLSTACASCHIKDWQSTTSPAHALSPASFPPNECQTCHQSFDTWFGSTAVQHDKPPISFSLTLGHAVPCEQCHVGGNFNLHIAANQCGTSGCHLITWQNTNAPPHSTAGSSFGLANCSNCHTPAGWTAPFAHSTTGFTLVGTHMSPTPTPCASCHINNNYTLSSTDCYGCHQAVFQTTTTPNHVTAGFPTTSSACATCHTITTWSAGVFDHSATGFLLTNGHANRTCDSCHVNNNYALKIAPSDCANSGCHLTDWQNTNAPPHSTSGSAFALGNCANCHTTVVGWNATFDHSVTGFALTGMHVSPPATCISCHVGNNYLLKSAACYGCHIVEWQSTSKLGVGVPDHVAAGFPQDCSICHSTLNWTGSTFNHTTTGFALTGKHVSPPALCSSCHLNNNYTLNSAACYGCHTTDWQKTATLGGSVPNHITGGYPQTCESCHTTDSWLGAVFDHSTTGFALTGLHMSPPRVCTDCHVSSARPPIDCYNCHTTQWNSTAQLGGSVPNHMAVDAAVAGIINTTAACSTCHNTTTFLGATFTHAWWSVQHGNAGGVCLTCHASSGGPSGTYVIFMCSGACHARPGIDNTHNGNPQYVWSSGPTCYTCHKNGGG